MHNMYYVPNDFSDQANSKCNNFRQKCCGGMSIMAFENISLY